MKSLPFPQFKVTRRLVTAKQVWVILVTCLVLTALTETAHTGCYILKILRIQQSIFDLLPRHFSLVVFWNEYCMGNLIYVPMIHLH